jgi:hypothetical protein
MEYPSIYSNLKKTIFTRHFKHTFEAELRQTFVSDYINIQDYDRNVNIHNRLQAPSPLSPFVQVRTLEFDLTVGSYRYSATTETALK